MFLAMKELLHDKLRFLMIALILVMIAWLVFILSGLGNGLSTLSAASFKNMDADYVVFEQGSRNAMSRSTLSEDLVGKLIKQVDVTAVSPMGQAMATVLRGNAKSDEDKVDIAILGVYPGSFLEPTVIEGTSLSQNKPDEVIVNVSMKEKGFNLGDTLELEGSLEKMVIVGFVENQTYNHVPAVFTTLEKWRTIHYAAPGSDKGIKSPVNAIMLQGDKIDAAQVNKNIEGIETATRAQAVQGMPGYKEENGTIAMMLVFLLAISAFVIAVFFYVLTLQKSNQFGIMKAIGASNAFLAKAIVSQVVILAAASIFIGILLTYGTAAILPEAMPFALDPTLLVVYAVVLLIIAVLSSLLSVRKITKIDPLEAIGRAE